jgi:signal transduction protein with GAF and PtsI domain
MPGDEVVGSGIPIWDGDPVDGIVVEIRTADDVVRLLDQDLDDKIILIHFAGATMLAALFSELRGIICTTGGIGSHVAMLSREFAVPCLMAASIGDAGITDRRVRIDSRGDIVRLDD